MPDIKLPPLNSIKLPEPDDVPEPQQPSGIKLPELSSIKLPEPDTSASETPEASWYNVITKSLTNLPDRAQRSWEGIKQGVSVAAQNTAQGVTAMQAQSIAQAAAQGVESATAQMAQLGYTPDQVIPSDGDSYETKLQKNQNLYAMIDKMKVANLQNDPGFVEARDKALKLSGDIAANTPQTDNWSAKGIVSAITGATADMAGPIGLAMLTKSPAAGLGAMTGQAYGQYYQDSIDKGLDPVKAQSRATLFAALEPLTEAVPLGLIMKKGATGLTDLGKSAIAEGLQEGTTQAIQNGYDIGALDEKMTVGQFLNDVAFNAVVGAGAGGAIHSAVHAPEMLSGKAPMPINLPETPPTAVPEGEYDAMAAEAAPPADTLEALQQQIIPATPAGGDALSVLAERAATPAPPINLPASDALVLPTGEINATQIGGAGGTIVPPIGDTIPAGDLGGINLPQVSKPSDLVLPSDPNTIQLTDASPSIIIPAPDFIRLPEASNAPTLALPDAPIAAKPSMRSRKAIPLALPDDGTVAAPPRIKLPSDEPLTAESVDRSMAQDDNAESLSRLHEDVAAGRVSQGDADNIVQRAMLAAKKAKDRSVAGDYIDEASGRLRGDQFGEYDASTIEEAETGNKVAVNSLPAFNPSALPRGVEPMAARKPKQNNEVFEAGDTFSVPKKLGTLDPDTNYTVEQKLGTSLVLRSEGGVPAVITEKELQKAFVAKNPKGSAPVSTTELGAQKEDTGSNSVEITLPTDVVLPEPDATPSMRAKGDSGVIKDISGKRIDKDWVSFNKKSGTINIPRADMPQIAAEHRGAMVNFLEAKGVSRTEDTVPATSLKATQSEYSPDKVRRAKEHTGGNRSILVSSDGHILDGHHQWLAARDKGEEVRVIRLNAPIRQLVGDMADFPSAGMEKAIPSQKRTPSVQSSKKSLTPEQTISAYKSFTKGMLGTENLQFTVYGRQSDLTEALGLPDGDGRTYMAFYNPGGVEVIAVSENIHTEEEAHAQFRHEIIAHYGLRARLSKPEYDAAMDRVLAAEGVDARLDPYFKEVRDNYGDVYDLTSPDGQRMIAEEVVAAVAENPAQAQKIGVIRNVIETIKKMLRDIGLLPARATYQDVVDLIQANTDYLRGNRVSNDDVRRSIAPMRFEPTQNMAPSMRRDRRVEETVAPADIKGDMGDTLHAEEGSITATINGIMDNNARKEAASRLYQSAIDDLSPIAHYERLATPGGELRTGAESAYKMASNSRQVNSIIASAMNVGVPMWNAEMGIVTKPSSKGLLQIFEPIAKMKGNQLALWEHWAGAVRANRLLKEGRENLYTQEMVDRVVNYVNSKPELRKAFNEAHKEYQVFKKDLLDFAEKAGTIDPVARKVWDKDDYVPLYRVADEMDRATAPGGAGRSFVNQSSGIRTLRGGTGKVDIINNILRNASHMISSSYNNRVGQMVADLTNGVAMEEVPAQFKPVSIKNEQMHRAMNELGISINGMTPQMAEEYSKMFTTAPPVGKDIVSVMYDGKRKYFRVTDPQLMRAINKVGPQAVGSIIKTMGWLGDVFTVPKKLLTRTVTSTPGFVVRNITRDILGNYVQQTKAAGRQGVGRIMADSLTLRPITKALKGAMDTARDSANVQAYRAAGGFSGGYDGARPDALTKQLRRMTKENTLTAAPRKLIHAYDRMLEAGELGTRMAVYDDVLKRTGSTTEAAYQANDVMNFSRRGDNALLGFFLDVVPFMNARIQGFDRLVRGAVESPKSFMLKGAMLSAATLALMAMNADDERYWALPETTRDNYWIFPIAGGFVQIPKPFEVGSIFGTVLERGYEAATRDDKVFWRAMGSMFLNTFAMNPTPQAISPIIQDYMNKDFFMGRPIVSEGMKYKDAPDQSDAYTPKVLSDLGKALPESFPDFLRSPVRLQHLLEGYTGSVGQYVLASSDAMYQSALSDAERPARSDMDIPVANLFVKPDNKSSKYVSRVYEMQQETRKATAKLKQYQETRDYDGIRQTRDELGDTLRASKGVERAAKQLSNISKQVKEIIEDPDMTAEAKRAEMDKLTAKKNAIAKEVNDKYWTTVHQ